MNIALSPETIERWKTEDDLFQAEVKQAAENEAHAFVNSHNFTAVKRAAATRLDFDDFKADGDLAFRADLVIDHPAFGDDLRALLDQQRLPIEDNDGYLPDATEAFVTVFFNTLWNCLAEYESRRHRV